MNEWPPINLQDSLSCDRRYGPFTRFQKYKTFIPISFPSKKVSAFVCYIFDLFYNSNINNTDRSQAGLIKQHLLNQWIESVVQLFVWRDLKIAIIMEKSHNLTLTF